MISCIVLAGGIGSRMKNEISKQLMIIGNKPVLCYSLEEFNNHKSIDEIVLVIRKEEEEYIRELVLKRIDFKKEIKLVYGGVERFDSVKNGLKKLDNKSQVTLIHDGARPFLNKQIIDNNLTGIVDSKGCITGVKVKDTIKLVNKKGIIEETPNRNNLFIAQTPQTFRTIEIIRGYNGSNNNFTDDSMILEEIGIDIKIVEGSYENIKLTTPDDILLANTILEKRGSYK